MLLIQCLGILGAVVTQTATHLNLWGRAPDARVIAVDIVWTLFVGWWVVSVVWFRVTHRVVEDTPDGWYFHSLGIFWFGNAATLISFLLLTPYGTLDWLLLGCAFCMAPMVLEAIGTVRSPRFGPRPWLALLVPAVLPLAMGLYLITHHEPRAREMGLFYFLFLLLLIFLRELVQNVVNRLEDARNEAERERDARTRFLAAVSHDLAQPIHAARLFFEQALRQPDGPARQAAERGAHLAFDSTERLLTGILDRMRLDAGAVKPVMQMMSVGTAIRRAVEQATPLAELEGVTLRHIDSDLDVWADPALVDRILGNLIGNALRHAKAKRVLVGARRRGNRVHLCVVDDGIGVHPADQATLFDEFIQGAEDRRTSPGGFGLGLFSSRKLARLMNGELIHQANTRRGATFLLELARV